MLRCRLVFPDLGLGWAIRGAEALEPIQTSTTIHVVFNGPLEVFSQSGEQCQRAYECQRRASAPPPPLLCPPCLSPACDCAHGLYQRASTGDAHNPAILPTTRRNPSTSQRRTHAVGPSPLPTLHCCSSMCSASTAIEVALSGARSRCGVAVTIRSTAISMPQTAPAGI